MIGQTFSHYRILEKAGEGGMGLVYKALDLRLERYAALKFLPHNCRPQEEDRLLQEAKAASAIDHPNICTIYEIGEAPDGRPFIAMAYYEGSELRKEAKSGLMTLADTLDIAIQIADGLSVAHRKGIVHRDIKSTNILVCHDPQRSSRKVKIIDFGLAQHYETSGTTENDSGSGTLAYMSPEQTRGEPVDQTTDIWSLGVVLYEMLSGRLPFANDHREATAYLILNEDPPDLSSLRPDIPAEVAAIVSKCLEKNTAARYQSAEAVLADLLEEKRRLEYSLKNASTNSVATKSCSHLDTGKSCVNPLTYSSIRRAMP